MTTTPTRPDLSTVKARQQKTWSSGDYSVVASRIALTSERLADTADLRAGWDVIDVACGSGNTSLAAARSGTHVVGIDYVPELLETARQRALAEGLDVEFKVGDAESLPAEPDSFDAAISVFGTMFAPDHQQVADEIVRVVRPGGTVALASWTPDGFIGQMFKAITAHVPPPPGVASPLLWGTGAHLQTLFGAAIADIRSEERIFSFRYESAEDFVAFFRRWYGPTLKAFEALDADAQDVLAGDLVDLVRRFDRYGDGGPVSIGATYLESVITLR